MARKPKAKAAVAAAAGDASLPRAYTRVDVAAELAPDAFEGVQKTGSAYAARLHQPVLVQTPPVVLLSSLADCADSHVTHAHLKVSSAPRFVQFVEGVEEALLSTSLASKDTWFRHSVHDDVLRASFRSFYKAGALRVRVPRDALLFDEEGQVVGRDAVPIGSTLRCLLELSKVTFGRTEYGAMWSLVQAQVVPAPAPPPPPPSPPKCLIDPGLSEHIDDDGADGAPRPGTEEDSGDELGDDGLGLDSDLDLHNDDAGPEGEGVETANSAASALAV